MGVRVRWSLRAVVNRSDGCRITFSRLVGGKGRLGWTIASDRPHDLHIIPTRYMHPLSPADPYLHRYSLP